ncbi:hypothetical protein [Tsukamurella ocularis]|uniref:hypothetical protein n=1 Tax=Tsukamurella ocularis TaxID=1970234 RepID=UPI00216AA38A|nr:hypothetical protein [Tsukamurella ocularis]MCS3780763.1 hypothetical protein [Tsukamurella ocularis]MCS3786587.1 hypothetical protein [Tsukamurella ocularis]
MNFAMRYDRWYRPIATAIGLGPQRTAIVVDGDTLRIRHGWAFRLEVPLANIRSARTSSRRPLAWGVHPVGDLWVVNGSRDGMVVLEFDMPVTSKSVQRVSTKWGEVRSLYLSLDDPEGFIDAMT